MTFDPELNASGLVPVAPATLNEHGREQWGLAQRDCLHLGEMLYSVTARDENGQVVDVAWVDVETVVRVRPAGAGCQ